MMLSNFFLGAIMLVMSSKNLYSQTNDTVSKFKKPKYSFVETNIDTIIKMNKSLKWTSKRAVKTESFSIYNKTTKSNDFYILNADKSNYTKSDILIENNFRNNKIDSFNPSGASNIQSGVLMGMFNLFTKK